MFALFAGVLIADRVTKILAERSLSMGSPVEVIPGFFQLTLVHNTGMAFGLLASASIPGKAWLLTAVSAGLLVAIVWFAWRAGPLTTMTTVGIVAMLSGAVGNILDRLLYGYVRHHSGPDTAVLAVGGDKTRLGNDWYPANITQAEVRIDQWCRQHPGYKPVQRGGGPK